jgi:hypothetical protein
MDLLLKRGQYAFWLNTSTCKFYPDFVARLADGRFLVVEPKGEYLRGAPDAGEKRAFSSLWADRSGGRRLLVMPKGLPSHRGGGAVVSIARRNLRLTTYSQKSYTVARSSMFITDYQIISYGANALLSQSARWEVEI